jgi:hypothetical protein
LPTATVVLDAVVTVPNVRPAEVIAVVAAACVLPTTFGTATCGGPLETTRLTEDPLLTCVPAVGLWLITLPEATVVLDAVVTVPNVRPAEVIAVVAAACVLPTTFGTATCGGPLETTRLTEDPLLTCIPDVGLWLITVPEATVVLDAVVTVPNVRPAEVIAVVAAACVEPTTFGTDTPLETTSATALPPFTDVPAVGLSLITLPTATVVLAAVVTVPSVRPAEVIDVVAAAWVDPTTFGTDTPLETTSATALPPFTDVPAVGLSLITLPTATVVLAAVVTVPSVSPAEVIDVVAAA